MTPLEKKEIANRIRNTRWEECSTVDRIIKNLLYILPVHNEAIKILEANKHKYISIAVLKREIKCNREWLASLVDRSFRGIKEI